MAARWGDEADDSDEEEPPPLPQSQQQPATSTTSTSKEAPSSSSSLSPEIPPTHKSKVDSKGIQIVTSYRAHPSNPHQLIKTVMKVKITQSMVKEQTSVETRRGWKKFGSALGDTSNVTIQSRDDVFLEDPHADTDLQDEDPTKALTGNLNMFWMKQQRRQLERRYDVEDGGAGADGAAGAGGAGGGATAGAGAPGAGGGQGQGAGGGQGGGQGGGGWTQVGSSSNTSGRYVPPNQRGGAGAAGAKTERRTDDLNTIRVTNISENTTEADLQDLFQPFGRISRVYLAKDKETMVSRGFAFVSFVHKEDAARAMEKLQGFGYDHLILKLEWARPNAKDPSTSGGEYRSGYGKALAQDTKEKVTYASNLTRGVR